MPRYSLGSSAGSTAAAASSSALPGTSNLSTNGKAYADAFTANIGELRRNWKFAAVCQFIYTFSEAFGLAEFRTESLEEDLAAATYQVVPDLMRRMLYSLTLDAKVQDDNWQEYLRNQYVWRQDVEGRTELPLGTEESPRNWEDLSLAVKVDTFQDLCDWQLVEPERFRKLVRNDEEAETWRVYPIGFDGQDNTYWLFDDNRLWIQHPPPPPPPKPKAPPKKGSKAARAQARKAAKAEPKAAPAASSSSSSSSRKGPGKRTASSSGPPQNTTPAKRSRSSLAGPASSSPSRPRHSRRLRGAEEENSTDGEGWEPIPAELLQPANGKRDDDEESELSEPPELEEPVADETMGNGDEDEEDEGNESKMDVDEPIAETSTAATDEAANQPAAASWLEYETIAVTRSEWQAMLLRFNKSKHPDEKALHKLLKDNIVPRVLLDLDEAEKAAALAAALAARKRSSRIAMKEAEKEEREKEIEAKARMEEKMRIIRQEEKDKRTREEAAKKEERQREERLREREDRLRQREVEAEQKAIREVEARERREKMREARKRRRDMIAAGELPPEEYDADKLDQDDEAGDEDWDLHCEICLKSARNPELEDDEQIVCCETCLVWQHTKCWDAFDSWAKHPRRNWDEEDFFCSSCRAKKDSAVDAGALKAKILEYRERKSGGKGTPSGTKKIVLKRTPSSTSQPGSPSPAVQSASGAQLGRPAAPAPSPYQGAQQQSYPQASSSSPPGTSGGPRIGAPNVVHAALPPQGHQQSYPSHPQQGPSYQQHPQHTSPPQRLPQHAPYPQFPQYPGYSQQHPYPQHAAYSQQPHPQYPAHAQQYAGAPGMPQQYYAANGHAAPSYVQGQSPGVARHPQQVHQPHQPAVNGQGVSLANSPVGHYAHLQQQQQQQQQQQPPPQAARQHTFGPASPPGAYGQGNPAMMANKPPAHAGQGQPAPFSGQPSQPRPYPPPMQSQPPAQGNGQSNHASGQQSAAGPWAPRTGSTPVASPYSSLARPSVSSSASSSAGPVASPGSASSNGNASRAAPSPSPHGVTTSPGSATTTAPVAANPRASSPAKVSATPTGSFPIRRPNASMVARSPLAGPSISPGGPLNSAGMAPTSSVPAMSLGETTPTPLASRVNARSGSPSPASRTGSVSNGMGSLPFGNNGSIAPRTDSPSTFKIPSSGPQARPPSSLNPVAPTSAIAAPASPQPPPASSGERQSSASTGVSTPAPGPSSGSLAGGSVRSTEEEQRRE